MKLPPAPNPAPPQRSLPRRDFLKVLALGPALAPGLGSVFLRLWRSLGGKVERGSADYLTLYCVGYAHLDTEWRWSYPIVIREFIRNTMEKNFPLFEKYPNYIFNFTGANRYRLMQEYYPASFERVRHYVAQGRWYPAGSSWEEGIVNEPSSESIVRQVLYGNRFFRGELGRASNEFMLPDSFGFPASLPSVLAHAGVKGFSTQKLTWGSAVGIPFNVGVWEGPDGRGVVAALNGTTYDGLVTGDLSKDPKWIERVKADGVRCGVYSDYRYYGTGDRGGAPAEASVAFMEESVAGQGPLHVISATGAQMFEDLTPEQVGKLPRYRGDLLLTEHSSGTPSSESFMKKLNRRNEFRADEAERSAVAAAFLGGGAYPHAQVTRGWQMLLAGQFHDILAGTILPDGYDYAWNDGFIANNQLTDVRNEGVGAVARALDTRGEGIPVVVYNSLSAEREDVVEAHLRFPAGGPPGVKAVGPDGKEAPAQAVRTEGDRTAVLILARMPSLGFAVYDVQPSGASAPADSELRVDERSLENARYRVQLNEAGDVAQIRDKLAGRDLLSKPARLALMRENPIAYPAWNMRWEDASAAPYAHVEAPAKVEIVERGPVRVALRVERKAGGSTIVQTIRLAAGEAGDRVEFDSFVDWHTPETALKAVFPLSVSNPNATYNWETGTVERGVDEPKRFEWPSRQWFDLTDTSGEYGVSVLEDCKYGSDRPDEHTLRLTLMFTPGTANAKPPGAYHDQATQDFGRHQFLYALAGHRGDWRAGETPWKAARLNQPLSAFQTSPHAGPAGRAFSLLKVSSRQVMAKAVKKAEDSDEVIVRLQELDGRPARRVAVSAASPIVAAREVDGQERPIGAAELSSGRLVVDMEAYRLQAFALTLGAAPARITQPLSRVVELPFDTRATSRDGEKSQGGIDNDGRCLPAEQFTPEVVSGGLAFRLGPQDGPNAVTCRGQTIELPPGEFSGLYLLATAAAGPATASFMLDDRACELTIQSWDGFIGRPDYRVWDSTNYPEISYGWALSFKEVAPGYLRPDPLAWFCSHRHSAEGSNEIYRYCYVYRYRIGLLGPVKRLTLAQDERIKILALTLGRDANDGAEAATPGLGIF